MKHILSFVLFERDIDHSVVWGVIKIFVGTKVSATQKFSEYVYNSYSAKIFLHVDPVNMDSQLQAIDTNVA